MNANRHTLLLLSLLAVFSACHKSAVAPFKSKELTLSVIEQQKVVSDNTFTFKLFKNLDSANTSNGNLFISPLSVGFALGMTSNGSKGQTLDAIRKAMDFTGYTQDQINDYYNKLLTDLPQLDQKTTVSIANSIWYRQGFSVLPAFLQTNSTYYTAKIAALDFTNPSALTTINNWVSDNTQGKIPGILDNIPSNAMMYLVNAIYFKSSWKESFDVSKTKNGTFYQPDNSTVQTSFMSSTIDFNYYYDNGINIYELPYANDKYSMVIVMPSNGTSLKTLENTLDSAKWQSWMTNLRAYNSLLTLPKFKFSYSTSLNDALTDLGMGIAFSNNADFSGISSSTNLQISEVKHKAFIETDESGTTAAAATVVGVIASVAEPPAHTVIDHPFIFVIREVSSGLILFAGTVNNPAQTE